MEPETYENDRKKKNMHQGKSGTTIRWDGWARMTTQSWAAQFRKNPDHRTLTKVSYNDLIILPQLAAQLRVVIHDYS